MVTNMSSQLTCQVFLETMKTCLSSSVQYQKMGQHSKVKGAKTILGFISRILCMVFQHDSLAYMNLQSSHTDKIYWTSFTPTTVYSKQRDLSKCSIYNSSGGPAQFAGPHQYIYNSENIFADPGYQNGICLEEWDTNSFPSFLSWGSAKQQVAFCRSSDFQTTSFKVLERFL